MKTKLGSLGAANGKVMKYLIANLGIGSRGQRALFSGIVTKIKTLTWAIQNNTYFVTYVYIKMKLYI